jgi:hypothetical protein
MHRQNATHVLPRGEDATKNGLVVVALNSKSDVKSNKKHDHKQNEVKVYR